MENNVINAILEELPSFILKEISNFFENYKVLQGISVEIGEYHGKEDAIRVIEECKFHDADEEGNLNSRNL